MQTKVARTRIGVSGFFVNETFSGKDLVPEQKNKVEEGGKYFQCRSSNDHEAQAGREQNDHDREKSAGKTANSTDSVFTFFDNCRLPTQM